MNAVLSAPCISGSRAAACFVHPETGRSLHSYLTPLDLYLELAEGIRSPEPDPYDVNNPLIRGQILEGTDGCILELETLERAISGLGALVASHYEPMQLLQQVKAQLQTRRAEGVIEAGRRLIEKSLGGLPVEAIRLSTRPEFRHRNGFMLCHPDVVYRALDGRIFLADIKTTVIRNAYEGIDLDDETADVETYRGLSPDHVYVQSNHNWYTCSESPEFVSEFGQPEPTFFVVVLGSYLQFDLVPHRIENERLLQLAQGEERFLNTYVIPKVRPAATNISDCKKLWPSATEGKHVAIDVDVLTHLLALKDARARKSAAEKEAKELEALIWPHIEDAELVLDPTGNPLCKAKVTERAGYTVEATSYRSIDFRIPKPKAGKK